MALAHRHAGAHAQRPLNEYKAEAFALFERWWLICVRRLRVEVVQSPPAEEAAQLPYMKPHEVDPTTGEDEMAPALAPALNRADRTQSERPFDLRKGRPQRAVPLRRRQEIQALPRQI